MYRRQRRQRRWRRKRGRARAKKAYVPRFGAIIHEIPGFGKGGGTEMDFGISISANEKRMSIFLTRQRDTGGNISGVCCRGARWKYDGGYGDDAISDGREKAAQAAKRYVFVVRRAARTPSLRREDRGRGRTRDPPTGFMKSQM